MKVSEWSGIKTGMITRKSAPLLLALLTGVIVTGTGIAGAVAPTPATPRTSHSAETNTSSFPVKTLQKVVDSPDVRLLKTVEALPSEIRLRFQEHPIDMKTGKPSEKVVNMANPGKSWNAGCMILPGLPSRQLQFAGISQGTCFVVFNTGGFASRQWVALFDVTKPGKPFIAGALASPRSTDMESLRRMAHSKQFFNAPKQSMFPL
jgi:hypothetical protein